VVLWLRDEPRNATHQRWFRNNQGRIEDLARIARNFVTIQRRLPEEHRGPKPGSFKTQAQLSPQEAQILLTRAMGGGEMGPWPVKIRDDFTDRIERFAEWAEMSGGFSIH
jgi:hypothetical protein